MDGLLALIHLVLFFVILRTALHTHAHWTRYFWLSIGASALVALVALFQYGTMFRSGIPLRPGGTIGNGGILAAYLMLHVFLCLLLLASERRSRWKGLLIASIGLDILMIYISGTRSVLLALLIVCPALAAARHGARCDCRRLPARTSMACAGEHHRCRSCSDVGNPAQ
jgi:hypothetical protein